MPYQQKNAYPYVNMSQGHIYQKLNSYLNTIACYEGASRENYLNKNGDCNGWAFLFAYYNSTQKSQEFKDVISYISRWNGNIASLYSNSGMSEQLQKKYTSGKQLFEQAINDISWFSQIKSKSATDYQLTQTARLKQFALVTDGKHELKEHFSFLKNMNTSIDDYDLPDMLRIAKQWKNSWLDLGVYNEKGGHALSVYIGNDGKFSYYDCNEYNGAFESYSAERISAKILNALGNDALLQDFSLYEFVPKEATTQSFTVDNMPASLDISMYSAYKFIDMSIKSHQLDPIVKLLSIDNTISNQLIKGYGSYYLHNAINENHTELTKLLIEKHIDVNARTYDDGKTPLMAAAKQGNLNIVSMLVKHGAEIDLTDYAGNQAIDFAEKHHHTQVANYLSNPFLTNTYDFSDILSWDVANTIYNLSAVFSQNHNNITQASSNPVLCMDDCLRLADTGIIGLENVETKASSSINQTAIAEESTFVAVPLQPDNTIHMVAVADIF